MTIRTTKRLFVFAASLAALWAITAANCIAQAPDEVDRFITTAMTKRQAPGAALVVIRDGKVIKRANYGLANVELNVPVNERTSFEIASMTKAFTAAAVMLLVEEGKLSLDDSVRKHIQGLPDSWQAITVRMLLDHTSGLYDDWDENNTYFLSNVSDDDFVRALAKKPLKFTPGERYSYSCGPFLAGVIIGKISGVSYTEFMQKRVFDRLEMRSTHVIDDLRIVPDRASGYVVRNGELQKGVNISPAAHARADVGIRTTADDLVKWDAALNKPGFFTQKSLEQIFAFAPVSDGTTVPSGLGWWLNPMRGRRVQQHGGAFRTGFNSTINRYPDDGLTVIYLTNVYRSGANDLGHFIAGFYLQPFRSLTLRTAKADHNVNETRERERLLAELRAGKYNSQMLAAGFPRRYFTPEDWIQLSDSQPELSFIDCDAPSETVAFGQEITKICYYSVMKNTDKFVSFWSGKEGKIVYIEPYEF